jgi:transcriptional regulator with GAF, ATPase, and Fis domain
VSPNNDHDFYGEEEMFEALTSVKEPQPDKTDNFPASIEVQLGVLKEVARGLLHQLETLKRGSTSSAQVERRNLHEEVREFEIDLINNALAKTQGHQRKAARLLGLKVTTLNAKMKRYNIMSRFYMPIGESTKH